MEQWLQEMMNSSELPIVTAFLLGLLTAISPCPLATNVTAVGFIGRDIEQGRRVFVNGLLYTLGRVVSYLALGAVLIVLLRAGSNIFHIQQTVSEYGDKILGPALLIAGLFMLFGNLLNLPSLGVQSGGEGLAKQGGLGALLLGMLFALAFCPASGFFYFGMLIPMSADATGGLLLPVVFAIATGIPVIVVAWILAFSIQNLGKFYNGMKVFEKYFRLLVGALFLVVGAYYMYLYYIQ